MLCVNRLQVRFVDLFGLRLFATIIALNAEIQRAATIKNNLQSQVNNRVSKTGGAMTGSLTIDASHGRNVTYDPGGQVMEQYTNYAGITSTAAAAVSGSGITACRQLRRMIIEAN